jgi:hypothetical protein
MNACRKRHAKHAWGEHCKFDPVESFDSMTATQCLIALMAKFLAVLGTSIYFANLFEVLASKGFHIVFSEYFSGRFALCVTKVGFLPFLNHRTDVTTVRSWKCFKTISIV